MVSECREFLSTGAGAVDLEEARSQGFTLVDFVYIKKLLTILNKCIDRCEYIYLLF